MAFLNLGILVVSDVVDRLTLWCFKNIIGYFYLSGASGLGGAVNISYSAVELDDRNSSRLPLIFTMFCILLPHFRSYLLRYN